MDALEQKVFFALSLAHITQAYRFHRGLACLPRLAAARHYDGRIEAKRLDRHRRLIVEKSGPLRVQGTLHAWLRIVRRRAFKHAGVGPGRSTLIMAPR